MQVSIGNIPFPLVEELNSALYIFGITAVIYPMAQRRGSVIQIVLVDAQAEEQAGLYDK